MVRLLGTRLWDTFTVAAPALGCFQLLQRSRQGRGSWRGRGWSAADRLGSSGASSLLLTTAWPERSQLSGSQKLLARSLAPFSAPNRAMIHAGRLIVVGVTQPSADNPWRRGRAGAAPLSPLRGLGVRADGINVPQQWRALSVLPGFSQCLGSRG